jgi:uncharacterized protein YjeT (DUF2065 family)
VQGRTKALRGLGNAIVPKVAKEIISAILISDENLLQV